MIRERVLQSVTSIRRFGGSRSSSSTILRNVFTQIAILGVNFCTGLLIARAFGRIGRGEVTAMILWPQLLAAVFSFGIPNGVVFYARKYPEKEGSYVMAAFAVSGIASCAMVVFGYLVIPKALHAYDPQVVRAAQFIIFLSPFVLISSSMSAFFQARNEFSYFNLLKYLSVIPTLLCLLILLKIGKLTPITAALCYSLPPIPIFFFSLRRLLSITKASLTGVRSSMRLLAGYGVRGAGLDLIAGISSQVDQVCVVGFLTVADMGIYAVALSVSRTLNVFFTATVNVVMPKSVSLTPNETTLFIGRALRLSAAAAVGAAMILAAIIPFLLPRVYGSQFGRAVPISIALLGEYILTGSTGVLVAAFMSRGRPGTVTLLEGASLITNVLLMFVLIPRFALAGAAASLILTSCMRFIAFYTLYRPIVGSQPPALILRTDDIFFVRDLIRRPQATG